MDLHSLPFSVCGNYWINYASISNSVLKCLIREFTQVSFNAVIGYTFSQSRCVPRIACLVAYVHSCFCYSNENFLACTIITHLDLLVSTSLLPPTRSSRWHFSLPSPHHTFPPISPIITHLELGSLLYTLQPPTYTPIDDISPSHPHTTLHFSPVYITHPLFFTHPLPFLLFYCHFPLFLRFLSLCLVRE